MNPFIISIGAVLILDGLGCYATWRSSAAMDVDSNIRKRLEDAVLRGNPETIDVHLKSYTPKQLRRVERDIATARQQAQQKRLKQEQEAAKLRARHQEIMEMTNSVEKLRVGRSWAKTTSVALNNSDYGGHTYAADFIKSFREELQNMTAELEELARELYESYYQQAATDLAAFNMLQRLIRDCQGVLLYPDDWTQLVGKHRPNPSLYDYGLADSNGYADSTREPKSSQLRDDAIEALETDDTPVAKLILAWCDHVQYGKEPYREKLEEQLRIDLAKLVRRYNNQEQSQTTD